MAVINSINSIVESYLNINKKDTGINNKPVSQINYSEDSYVPATKFATDLGVYSKETDKCDSVEEVEEKVSFEEEYEEYCVLLLYGNAATGLWDRIYYPPPNAPDNVKKAWIETMKSLTVEEQHRVTEPIITAMMNSMKKTFGDQLITTEMLQNYLNNQCSFSDLTDFFTEKFLDSKIENYDPFMENILNKFKANYAKYSEK